jgi:hypothetical protein
VSPLSLGDEAFGGEELFKREQTPPMRASKTEPGRV